MRRDRAGDFQGLIIWSVSPDLGDPGIPENLRDLAEGREFVQVRTAAEAEPLLNRVEIALGDIPFKLLPRMPRLKWLQLWSAGADILQRYPELKTMPFQLTNTSGIHRRQLAEHTFALILAWNRRLREALDAQKQRLLYRPAGADLGILEGKTMLILGYGVIGEAIARIALLFGMEVRGIRRGVSAPSQQGAVRVFPAAALEAELRRADYVVNILPLTPETRRIMGKKEFDAMKPQAVYVNVGRGKTTDEAALIEALQSRRIAGALLDVSEQEPPPPDSALWDMDRVIYTAHYAGLRPGYNAEALKVARENLGRYVRGEPLINLVDKTAGY
ncbi:MAG: D-2-hydroxyacid dehydrogenase [Treponema sp.]|nr:D-2-hydroxyacid dehydrogenase [Treponema sp.]